MNWQDKFQIDGGEWPGLAGAVVVVLIFLLVGASYYHHSREVTRDSAPERTSDVKQGGHG